MELTRRKLPQDISKQMKLWHKGFIPMPQGYVDFHRALADETLEAMEKAGIKIHSKELLSDGWGDGMRAITAVVEKNDQLVKIQWCDSNQGFMFRTAGGGWSCPTDECPWLRPYFSRSSK